MICQFDFWPLIFGFLLITKSGVKVAEATVQRKGFWVLLIIIVVILAIYYFVRMYLDYKMREEAKEEQKKVSIKRKQLSVSPVSRFKL